MKLFKNADKRVVTSGLAIALGAVVIYCVMANIGTVWGAIKSVLSVFSLVFWGLILAYVLRPIANFLERVLLRGIKKQKTRTSIGALLTLVLLIVFIVLVLGTFLPQLVSSGKDLVNHYDSYLESVKTILKEYAAKLSFIEIDVDRIIGTSDELLRRMLGWVNDNLNLVIEKTGQVVGAFATRLMNFVIVITMAVYALLDRANLKKSLKRVEKALVGDEKTKKVNRILAHGDYLMLSFLGSNLLDALIIGVINFIFLGIVKQPYQLILAFILGATNFIPTFGPIIGGVIGAVIVLFTKPSLLLVFIIFTMILQQIDGNIIKPLLFGDSTGLSPFWVLVAIVVGGEVLGLWGMIVGVPLVALASSVLDELLARVNGEEIPDTTPAPSRLKSFFQKLKKQPPSAAKPGAGESEENGENKPDENE